MFNLTKLPEAITAAVKILIDSDAGIATIVGKDINDDADWAIIVVQGEGTQEIVSAVSTVSDKWG